MHLELKKEGSKIKGVRKQGKELGYSIVKEIMCSLEVCEPRCTDRACLSLLLKKLLGVTTHHDLPP